MPTYYLDYENGSDSNDGTSWVNAWKTLTTGTTASRIANGDIICIAKSPIPYSIGTATWTDLSKNVSLSASQTRTIDNCELGWTANPTGDTTATRIGVATTAKEGSYSMRFALDASVQTNIMQAYYTVASSGSNLSEFQKISFWFQNQTTAIQNGTLFIKLCDDISGSSPVDSFTIPSIPSTARWIPLTLTRTGGGNCGSSIKSIAIYSGSWVTGLDSNNLWLDNVIACTASGLNLQSLISKNSLEQEGDETWYGIQSINGSTILLDNETATKSNEGRGYSGTTGSAPTYARETIKTDLVTLSSNVVQEVMKTGVQFQGGYDTTSGSQTGETFFDGLNGMGYGIQISSKSSITLNHINTVRYNRGIYFSGCNNSTITSVTGVNNCTGTGLYLTSSNNNTITKIIGANNCGTNGIIFSNGNSNIITTLIAVNNNMYYGFYFSNSGNNLITTLTKANNNGNYGLYIYGSNNNIIKTVTAANNNGVYGVQFSGACNNIIANLNTTGNLTSAIGSYYTSWNYINNATIAESIKAYHEQMYSDTRVFFEKINNYARIDCDIGNIIEQGATGGGTGNEWKMNVTNTARGVNYPLEFKIAEIACNANQLVTVTCYFKKSHATDIAAKLITPGDELTGVSETSTTCPSDTNRNQLQIQFTPTEAGVVAIEAWAWWVSNTADENVIIDDISVTQG